MPVISADATKKLMNSNSSSDSTPESGLTAVPEKSSSGPTEEAAGIRILLADSQAIYRVGIRKIFAVEDDMRVVAQAENYPGLLAALERYPSDIVLLDGGMISGQAEAIPDMLKRAPNAKLIVQVSENSETFIVDLYRRGVRGVISRSISPDLLIRCVRKIADGETWIDNQSVSWVIEAYRTEANNLTNPKLQPRLSPKELSIIGCVTQGMRNKEIAYKIGTTEQVVKNYLRKIYDKLGVSDRLELALYCLHHQLLKQPSANTGTGKATVQEINMGRLRP
ncbi:MAG TPA: response regulator transcription factor [Acidobacteriaceae bacterium]|nr:response regulator transcription factor [Acidobacteriaceae bacterium]